MKRNRPLFALATLALSAAPLLAQDNPPAPASRPPQPPPGEHGPRRDGGNERGEGRRPMPGIFGALDGNHDGALDQGEIAKAADFLRKLDRNGDGRILPDEVRPPGDGQRPRGENERGAREREPQAREGERREPRADGQREEHPRAQAPRTEGRPDQGPRPEQRREEPRRDGDRERGPQADGRHPQRGPGDGPKHDGPPPARDGGEARHHGPQDQPPGAQAQHRHHRGPDGARQGERFAQRPPRPDFGGDQRRAPWEGAGQRRGMMHGPMAMGPRGPQAGPGREGAGRQQFRHDLGARGPQGPGGSFRPPMPPPRGGDHPMPPRMMNRPQSGPPQAGPGEFRRPELPRDGDRDGGRPQGPRDDRGPRPPRDQGIQ